MSMLLVLVLVLALLSRSVCSQMPPQSGPAGTTHLPCPPPPDPLLRTAKLGETKKKRAFVSSSPPNWFRFFLIGFELGHYRTAVKGRWVHTLQFCFHMIQSYNFSGLSSDRERDLIFRSIMIFRSRTLGLSCDRERDLISRSTTLSMRRRDGRSCAHHPAKGPSVYCRLSGVCGSVYQHIDLTVRNDP